jgi:Spy/CpxP family protein refolding chaperone
MKKSIVLFSLVSALAIIAFAGSSVYARGNGGKNDGRQNIQKELNLTAEQQDKIFKINQDFRQKAYDNRKDTIKVAELRVEKLKAVYAVLTPEQKEKFNTLHQNRQGKSGCGKGNCW